MQKQTHGAWQWNPPPGMRRADTPFDGRRNVESANECTGLMTNMPRDEDAAVALSELYDIHQLKTPYNKRKETDGRPEEKKGV